MVTRAELREIIAALPDVVDGSTEDRLGFSCRGKGIAWTFMQRDAPRQPRWPNLDVLAVSCPLERKEMLIAAAPDIYFDDDHYRGYPAVLTRLPAIDGEEMEHLLRRACEYQLSKPKRRR
jgi:hypothetical protein